MKIYFYLGDNMSNPVNSAATQQDKDGKTSALADKVAEVLKEAKTDAKGNLILPDDLDPDVSYAATLEKRRRDTQAAHTKDRQELNALKSQNQILLEEALGVAELDLSEAQLEELEDLKISDPETWRKKMNAYEVEAKGKKRTKVEDKVKTAAKSVLDEEEIANRKVILEEFLEAHEGFYLDDDVIANDIPPRITKKLEKGEISFDEFLTQCYEYTQTGKVIKQEKVNSGPNMSRAPGGRNPDNRAVKEDIIKSYNNETY